MGQNARVDFIVTTPTDPPRAFKGAFKIEPNGVLIVDDPDTERRTTYSPVGWVKVEQQLPFAPSAAMPKMATGPDESMGGF
jgi:hypothetical protein